MKAIATTALGIALLATATTYGQCSLTSRCGTAKPEQVQSEAAEVNTAGLAVLLRTGQSFVLLDARSGKYDDGRRIPGAKSLTDKASADEAAGLIPAKDSLVVTYCASTKCPASKRLAKHLTELGYTNVIEYPEGIAGWEAAGNVFEVAK